MMTKFIVLLAAFVFIGLCGYVGSFPKPHYVCWDSCKGQIMDETPEFYQVQYTCDIPDVLAEATSPRSFRGVDYIQKELVVSCP